MKVQCEHSETYHMSENAHNLKDKFIFKILSKQDATISSVTGVISVSLYHPLWHHEGSRESHSARFKQPKASGRSKKNK